MYSYQTGRFPITSRKGSKYVMIVYEYDSNHIHGEPIKYQNAVYLTRANEKLHKMFTSRGLQPQLHILDNECSNLFKNFMTKVDEKFQFVPPHLHQLNAAKRQIQTSNNHFIAGISSVNKDFPMHLWCRLIPQACPVLNLPRQSRINPKFSDYEQVHGAYYFNTNPVAPPGTRVVVHENPAVRGSWLIRGIGGWYLCNALHHCICFEVFVNNTAQSRISDTVEFFPHHFTMPFPSSEDNAIEEAEQLARDLQNIAPISPFSQLGDSTMASIKQLSVALRRQIDAIQAVVNSPSISKPPQPKIITTIPKSPHHTPHIIENYNVSITTVHRMIAHQSNLRPHIIPQDTPQPIRTENV